MKKLLEDSRHLELPKKEESKRRRKKRKRKEKFLYVRKSSGDKFSSP